MRHVGGGILGALGAIVLVLALLIGFGLVQLSVVPNSLAFGAAAGFTYQQNVQSVSVTIQNYQPAGAGGVAAFGQPQKSPTLTYSSIIAWGDGSSAPVSNGQTVTHSYANAGSFNVTLSMGQGASAPQTGVPIFLSKTTVYVVLLFPGASSGAVGSANPQKGPSYILPSFTVQTTNLSVTVSDTTSGSGLTIRSANWTWGDGSPSKPCPVGALGLLGCVASHGYAASGTYQIAETFVFVPTGSSTVTTDSVSRNVTVSGGTVTSNQCANAQGCGPASSGGFSASALVVGMIVAGIGLILGGVLIAAGDPKIGLAALLLSQALSVITYLALGGPW